MEELTEIGLQRDGDDDLGDAEIDKVDNEDGDGCDGGDEKFVAPANIKKVVADSEDDDGLKGEDRGEVGC